MTIRCGNRVASLILRKQQGDLHPEIYDAKNDGSENVSPFKYGYFGYLCYIKYRGCIDSGGTKKNGIQWSHNFRRTSRENQNHGETEGLPGDPSFGAILSSPYC